MDEPNRAEAVCHARASLTHHRIEAIDEGDRGDRTFPASGDFQVFGGRKVEGERLLAHHVFARRQSELAQRCVELVRRADVDRRRRLGDATSVSPSANARSAPSWAAAASEFAGVDAATPTTLAPARWAARACTAPMKPAPTTPTLNGDRPLGPGCLPPTRRYCPTLMSAVNQNLTDTHAELEFFCIFDRPKSRWNTVVVSLGSEHAPPPTGSNAARFRPGRRRDRR